jgi:serpin B
MKSFLWIITCLFPLLLSAGNLTGISENNNTFAFKLYRELHGHTNENMFYSPFSISTALAMTFAGARNETALQISKTMYFSQGEKFHAGYKQLLKQLDAGTEGKIKLNIANGLWAQQDFPFLASYFELVKTNYNSELKNVDFIDVAKRETTRKEINSWVEQKTNDKIKNILGKRDLDSMTKLVLVNAIYFYGDWAEPFTKEATRSKDFNLSEEEKIKVPFMNQRNNYNYYEDAKIQAIEIPYKGNKASMVIFLPVKNNGISEFEKSINYQYYQDIITAFQSTEAQLSLPKFQTTSNLNLGTTLSQMGMPLAFSQGADFSGMTGKRDLWISEVIHQAFIHVDELGTEAAAATAVLMVKSIMKDPIKPKIFNADHPFVFLIKENATGSILFMGKIMKPEVPE